MSEALSILPHKQAGEARKRLKPKAKETLIPSGIDTEKQNT
jgi:hypothetical protein